MGLNMLSAPSVSDVNGIWDTRSNECIQTPRGEFTRENSKECICGPGGFCDCCGSISRKKESQCKNNYSVPTICDVDVRSVNRIIQQRQSNN